MPIEHTIVMLASMSPQAGVHVEDAAQKHSQVPCALVSTSTRFSFSSLQHRFFFERLRLATRYDSVHDRCICATENCILPRAIGVELLCIQPNRCKMPSDLRRPVTPPHQQSAERAASVRQYERIRLKRYTELFCCFTCSTARPRAWAGGARTSRTSTGRRKGAPLRCAVRTRPNLQPQQIATCK